jgi:hypothetical protein
MSASFPAVGERVHYVDRDRAVRQLVVRALSAGLSPGAWRVLAVVLSKAMEGKPVLALEIHQGELLDRARLSKQGTSNALKQLACVLAHVPGLGRGNPTVVGIPPNGITSSAYTIALKDKDQAGSFPEAEVALKGQAQASPFSEPDGEGKGQAEPGSFPEDEKAKGKGQASSIGARAPTGKTKSQSQRLIDEETDESKPGLATPDGSEPVSSNGASSISEQIEHMKAAAERLHAEAEEPTQQTLIDIDADPKRPGWA